MIFGRRIPRVSLLCALCLALLLVLPERSGRARPVPPARDFRLVIFAIGDWKGNFETDVNGRGGLAALHTLVRRTRERTAVSRGRSLLVHAGDLTGAENRVDFYRKLLPPGLNLPRYLSFDAVALSPRENQFMFDTFFLPGLRFARAVEFAQGLPASLDPAVGQFRIAPGEDYNVFLSGWTTNPALGERSKLLKSMRTELDRQTGLDLRVLLVSGDRLNPREPTVAETLLRLAPDQNPYDLIDPKKRRPFLVVRSSAERNRFEQLTSGAHLCQIRGRDVCRVEYTFRDHRLIAVNQRFIDLNARDRAGAWIPPDPRLVKVLRKARERSWPPLRDPRGEKVDADVKTNQAGPNEKTPGKAQPDTMSPKKMRNKMQPGKTREEKPAGPSSRILPI